MTANGKLEEARKKFNGMRYVDDGPEFFTVVSDRKTETPESEKEKQ